MDEARLWGLLGVGLAVAGVVVIAPSVLEATRHGGSELLVVGYGVAVLLAAVVTVAVIGPSLVGGR